MTARNPKLFCWVLSIFSLCFFFVTMSVMAQSFGVAGSWNFNGNTLDLSGNNNNGAVTGTKNWTTGKVESAFDFNGSTYINCGNNSSLSISDNISIELWLYPDQWVTEYAAHPINKWTTTADANYVMYFFGSTAGANYKKIGFYANAGGQWRIVSPYYLIPSLNTWYHIVWTYNSISGGKLYVNGTLYGSTPGYGTLATNVADLKVGRFVSPGFTGILDEVKVYNKVLSDSEVVTRYKYTSVVDDFSTSIWTFWKSDNSIATFSHNPNMGHNAPGAAEIAVGPNNPSSASQCYLKRFNVRPCLTYTAVVYVRAQDIPPDSEIRLSFQGQDHNGLFLGNGVPATVLMGANVPTNTWQRMELSFEIPAYDITWAKAEFLLCTIGISKVASGKVYFDDFEFLSPILPVYNVTLNGVNSGQVDTLDRLEAEFHFWNLSEAEQTLLDQGNLVVNYNLTLANTPIANGQWTFSQQDQCKILTGVNQSGGSYHLKTSLGTNGNISASIVRPDLAFATNGIGAEDVVPNIWQDFAVNGRTVTLWNRVYQFGDGPLPTAISAFGTSILNNPPQLIIETTQGIANITYQAGQINRSNCSVTFNGFGAASNFTLDYATTVEFDGLIKFDFTIHGCPEITSMRLEWQVKPEVCQFLMTPFLQESAYLQFEFPYPLSLEEAVSQLWLVSEDKGGFAYSMVNDANWVYDQVEPVFFVNKSTGQCTVKMITQTVTMPENTPYQALFIATPTRPLPASNRVIRFNDNSRSTTPRLGMAGGGDGLTGVSTFEPHPTDFEYCMMNRCVNTVSVYGTSNALTDASDIAMYFKKYWNIPGDYSYTMPYLKPLGGGIYEKEYHSTVSACNAGVINDYYMYNIKKLLEHQYGNRIWQIYYDLAANTLCGNPLHGCGFKDKFERDIKTFALLNKRKLVERTVRYCHANNRTVILHAQRYFSPFMSGLADYFFPGEQHTTLLRNNQFGYTDELPDELFRSEYNRNVLGVGVIFLPALNRFEPVYTEAMMSMLLLHDVETCQVAAAGLPIQNVWNGLEKYGVQSPETSVHFYYNQTEITSSQPNIRITWYECPGNERMLILSNKDSQPHTGTINVSAVAAGDFLAREEYIGTDINVIAGAFDISVPARSFRIVAFPPKSFYDPIQDGMDTIWGSWSAPGYPSVFMRDEQIGRNSPGSLKMQASGGSCFLKQFSVYSGRTYTATVYAKRETTGLVKITFQGKDINGNYLGVPGQSSQAEIGIGWQKLELSFTIPTTGLWTNCRQLLITFSGDDGIIWFDDFTLTEL